MYSIFGQRHLELTFIHFARIYVEENDEPPIDQVSVPPKTCIQQVVISLAQYLAIDFLNSILFLFCFQIRACLRPSERRTKILMLADDDVIRLADVGPGHLQDNCVC